LIFLNKKNGFFHLDNFKYIIPGKHANFSFRKEKN